MSLRAPESVQKLQTALHAKAKEMPTYRFYALYDKLYREDILAHAWRLAKANGGAAGVDGQSFRDVEEYGAERWLGELAEDLRKKTYRPQPVRRVYIPKPDGRKRPLGISTIRDRVAQTAAVLVLSPIFEADLQPEQYAYRQGRNAHDAVRQLRRRMAEAVSVGQQKHGTRREASRKGRRSLRCSVIFTCGGSYSVGRCWDMLVVLTLTSSTTPMT